MLRKAVLVASVADGIHEQWKLILEAGGAGQHQKPKHRGEWEKEKGKTLQWLAGKRNKSNPRQVSLSGCSLQCSILLWCIW